MATQIMTTPYRTRTVGDIRSAISLASRLRGGCMEFGGAAATDVVATRVVHPHTRYLSVAARVTLPRGIGGRALIDRLRDMRSARDPLTIARAGGRSRLASTRRVERALEIVADRGLSTPAGHDEHRGDYMLLHRDGSTYLIGGSWWYSYGRQGRRYVSAAYLAGSDEGEPWAIRVPASCSSVAGATEWTWGARASRELRSGRPWRRQGDALFTSLPGRRAGRRAPSAQAQAQALTLALAGTRHSVDVHGGGGLIARHEGHHRTVRLPLGGGLVWRVTLGRQDVGARGRQGCGD